MEEWMESFIHLLVHACMHSFIYSSNISNYLVGNWCSEFNSFPSKSAQAHVTAPLTKKQNRMTQWASPGAKGAKAASREETRSPAQLCSLMWPPLLASLFLEGQNLWCKSHIWWFFIFPDWPHPWLKNRIQGGEGRGLPLSQSISAWYARNAKESIRGIPWTDQQARRPLGAN